MTKAIIVSAYLMFSLGWAAEIHSHVKEPTGATAIGAMVLSLAWPLWLGVTTAQLAASAAA